MASSGTLDCLAKRDLLAARNTAPEKLKARAQAFIEAGMVMDAMRFLAAAGESEKVAEMAENAVEEGDLFLYLQALRELGREPLPDELHKLARSAEARGMLSFAEQAEKMADQDGNSTDG